MLGDTLNGLVLPEVPPPSGGRYAFRVLERYYGRRHDGGDLDVSYLVWVPADELQFRPFELADDRGFVLGVRPSTFEGLGRRATSLGVDDLAVYPAFEAQ